MEKNYKLFLELSLELHEYLKNLHGLFIDSVLGYKLIIDKVSDENSLLKQLVSSEEVTSEVFQDSLAFDHERYAEQLIPSAALFFHRKGDVKKRNEKEGENNELLVQMMIVLLYAYWEEYFREKVSRASGYKDKNEYQDDVWGLIGLLRNAILHNNGKVTKDLRKCLRKKGASLKKGQKLAFNNGLAREIFMLAYGFKNKLHSESLPQSSFSLRVEGK